MEDLRDRWSVLVGRSDAAERRYQDLFARWSQAHRRYHTITHLRAVLDAIDVLANEAADLDAVRLAAWFHDAVYDGRPGADEHASAALAAAALPELGVPPERVADVIRLVLLTSTHEPRSRDVNGAVLCDADLSILGSAPDDYSAYAAAVREEYSRVPDTEFRAGRRAVLERLVERTWLFHTARGRELWEEPARSNIAGELARLMTPGD